jgi:hypothetical protein
LTKKRVILAIYLIFGAVLVVLGKLPVWKVAIALAAIHLFLRVGLKLLGSFAQPIPKPPPPGELRKVRLNFRCSLCGTEVRMTVANDEMPNPPRHCQEDMELVAPVIE